MNNTIIAIDSTGSYRIYLSCGSDAVAVAEQIHKTNNPSFGMVLYAAGLMGLMLKGQRDKLTLIFKNGGEILATANAAGNIKGYISENDINLKGGNLTVIKDLGLKEPYIGKIELNTGDVSKDLANYFAISEQQPSAVSLAPNGGMIVQVLPNAVDEALNSLEDRLIMMDNIALLIDDAKNNPYELLHLIFGDDVRVLEERNISWQCDCSKERMAAALVSLGKKDLTEIIKQDGKAELTCQFCKSKYQFTKEELMEILENA